jgi:protein-L-isoaspartate(D-aspartate) O-methyltransferase
VNRTLITTLTGALAACGAAQAPDTSTSDKARARMVEEQIVSRGVRDPRVLAAMRAVPRHLFVPDNLKDAAYEDHPLPIGFRQTISQPYIVAYMTEAAGIRPGARVLEVGTGSGYQAAVLAEAGAEVFSIEIVPELARQAREALRKAGYGRVQLREGDGYLGWPEHAPFDAILVTAAPDHVPPPLVEQLKTGGRMVIPVGRALQEMTIISKTAKGATETRTIPVRFVPLVRPQ